LPEETSLMDEKSLIRKLDRLSLGDVRYIESLRSTNDEALAWAAAGAVDLSVVIADEQTAGRGRGDRKWYTPKGTALAFSLILRPIAREPIARTPGLAALSITDALQGLGLVPRIKWPNDILLNGKKVAGILIENVWTGAEVDSLVVGMGINVFETSIPSSHPLMFPATSVESELGRAPSRENLLYAILSALLARRPHIDELEFLTAWENLLAFRGEQVRITRDHETLAQGELLGLDADGGLRLRNEENQHLSMPYGEVSLRPGA